MSSHLPTLKLTSRGRNALASVAIATFLFGSVPTAEAPLASAKTLELHVKAITPAWTPARSKAYVKKQAAAKGWTGKQWKCLDLLVHHESRWNHKSDNKRSSAYGLFQVLKTPTGISVQEQTERGLRYIVHRYDTPCRAWATWQRNARQGEPWY